MPAPKKYADTQFVHFLQKRIPEINHIKSQAEIAAETGWTSLNMLSMIKTGAMPMPVERVFLLAKALDVDAARLLWLTLEQRGDGALARALKDIFDIVVTANELRIIEWIREVSKNTDPTSSARVRADLRAIFGK
jgi:transcriptional regulator with XRE-family HTH domain